MYVPWGKVSDISRIVCWFSCGAASAVATKLAITENAGKLPIVVARAWVAEEHPDNDRFASECAEWFGVPVTILKNEKFSGSVYEVIRKERYIVGVAGAPCTRALKRRVREEFQRNGDLQVFGYTAEEQDRYDRFLDANNDVRAWPILIENGLLKGECLAMVERAGIRLPAMYELGYRNNNCIGCVKGAAGYWNKIRVDFPLVFQRMAKTERLIGATICKVDGVRTYLDEMPPDAGDYPKEQEAQCGITCELAEQTYRTGSD